MTAVHDPRFDLAADGSSRAVYGDGLLRCCRETIRSVLACPDVMHAVGEIIDCQHCGADLRWNGVAWSWDHQRTFSRIRREEDSHLAAKHYRALHLPDTR